MSRLDQIIEVAHEAKEVLPDPYDYQICELVEDCTGFHLKCAERRLAIVAYDTDPETAKRSIWYIRG